MTNAIKNFKHHGANIILFGIDTLRYDHLSFTGYSRKTSPNIDKLATESINFKNCFSQAPTTSPSFASILTSRYPTFHGVMREWTNMMGWKLAKNIPTLAETLQKAGYKTAAFTEGGTLSKYVGLDKGFDIYETGLTTLENVDAHPATNWVEKNKDLPFFLFFHTFTTHFPYIAPAPYNTMYESQYKGDFPTTMQELIKMERVNKLPSWKLLETLKYKKKEVEHLKSAYDGCINYMDNFIGNFLHKLQSLDLHRNTIIIFTSDHGEEFMEHGNLSHKNLFDELLHVPLLIKFPGNNIAKSVDQIVRGIDIMPTILDMLNIESDINMQGESLLPAINNSDLNLISLAEFGYSEFSLRNSYYKYIFRSKKKKELYNISLDYLEKNDLSNYSIPLIEKLHNEFQIELTKKKLVRPPHNTFMLKHRTVAELKIASTTRG